MAAKKTPEILDAIVEQLSLGVTLREICREDDMPSWRAVYDWIAADEDFASRVARARTAGFDAMAEEALQIADDGTNDWVRRRRKDGSVEDVLDTDHVARSRLRIETRLKLLAKWAPSKYGDKIGLEHTGKDGGPVEIAHANVADLAKQMRAVAGQTAPVALPEPAKALPASSDASDIL